MPRASKILTTPGEQIIPVNECSSRSTRRLDSKNIHGLLAKALAGVSEDFDADITFFDEFEYANECTFSYNNTNWYGIFLYDSITGKPGWARADESGKIVERAHKLWFEVDFNDPNEPRIKEETATTKMPEFLKKVKQCKLDGGKCVVGQLDDVRKYFTGKGKKPTETRPSPVKGKGPELVPLPTEIMEKLNLADVPSAMESAGSTGGKTVTREYLESLSNDVLIDWMINNMQPQEILGCLGKSTGLTPTETKKVLEQIKEPSAPSSAGPSTSEVPPELISMRNNILGKEKNIGLTEEYFDTVKQFAPGIPGLRLEKDGGKTWIRSDLPRNKGWVTRDIFREYINSSSFGKRLRMKRGSKKQLVVRRRFQLAAKKCKGKKGYTKCMKKLLNKSKK